MRWLAVLGVMVLCLGALVGVQANPKPGGTLRFATVGDVARLDPHLTGDVSAWLVLEQVYERLLMLDENLELAPWLATDWHVSDDGLVYTFSIRQGVRFHNGREMTAEDVKKSLERIMDPDVGAIAAAQLQVVESIETPDPYTVVIRLSEPLASTLYTLARIETAIVPMEEVERQGGELLEPVGTGPFRFVRHQKDRVLELARWEHYWQPGLPYLDRVEFIPVPDEDVRLVNLQTGEMHVIQSVPAQMVDSLAMYPDIEVMPIVSTNWPHLAMNTKRPPFDDVRVRQAVQLVVDQQELLDLVAWGYGTVSASPLPPTSYFHKDVKGWEVDVERAKQLLAEAGYPNGFDATIRVIRGINARRAEVVQAQLAQIGIRARIQQDEQPTWFSEVFFGRDYDMALVAHVSKIDPDLSFYDILHSTGTKNYTQYHNPELDRLLDEGRRVSDPEQRKAIYDQVQEIIVGESGYVVVYLEQLLFGKQKAVKDFDVLTTGDIRFWRTWIDR